MTLRLPDSIITSADVASVQREIHAYSARLSHDDIKRRTGAKTHDTPFELSPAATELVNVTLGAGSVSASRLDELHAKLETYRKSAPTITITLAAIAPGELRQKLIGWVRRELDPTMLIQFKVNRAILGGMVVTRGSRIFDWSYRRKLLSSDVSFAEVLTRV